MGRRGMEIALTSVIFRTFDEMLGFCGEVDFGGSRRVMDLDCLILKSINS